MTMLTGAAGDGLLDKDNTDGGAQSATGWPTATAAENEALRVEGHRYTALDHAIAMEKVMAFGEAAKVVENAKLFEAYLNGTGTETAPAT
jgi:hypothetical protein